METGLLLLLLFFGSQLSCSDLKSSPISPANLMEVQCEDLNVEMGSNYFSFTALLFSA